MKKSEIKSIIDSLYKQAGEAFANGREHKDNITLKTEYKLSKEGELQVEKEVYETLTAGEHILSYAKQLEQIGKLSTVFGISLEDDLAVDDLRPDLDSHFETNTEENMVSNVSENMSETTDPDNNLEPNITKE